MNIEEELRQNFEKTSPGEVDFGLLQQNIIKSVNRLEKRRVLIRSGIWGVFSFISTFGLISSSIGFYQQFVGSGARELIAIAITDTSVILSNGTAFFYSLAESMPVGNIAGGLAATAALLYSLQHLSEILINNLSRKIYGHE